MHEIVKLYAPLVAREIEEKAQINGGESYGDLGSTLYYAHNYMSTQHPDHDSIWAISDQLEKISLPDEFNFALTKYQVYFVTEPGCVW